MRFRFMNYCECGCGQLVSGIFKRGHYWRVNPIWNKGLTKETSIGVLRQSEKIKGPKHPNFKNTLTTYKGKHVRIESILGKPSNCEYCNLDNPNKLYDLVNLNHEYDVSNLNDWAPLCKRCHRQYDEGKIKVRGLTIIERGASIIIRTGMKGKHHSEETKMKIKKARARQIITPETKAKMKLSQQQRWIREKQCSAS